MFSDKEKPLNEMTNEELVIYIKKNNRNNFILKSIFIVLLISGTVFASSLLNTKFGIGEVAPVAKLEVKGDGTTSATINTNLKNNANTSLFYVRDDGNIGVGNSGPTQKLDVTGNIKSSGRFLPNYDSGWVYVTSATTYELTLAHGFGSMPSFISLWQCGAILGSNCLTKIVQAVNGGYQGPGTNVNPVTVLTDSTNVYIEITSGWSWVWAYWNSATSTWVCTGDADANCGTGYYRVLAWK